MTKPAISVIMPVYNAEKYVAASVASVLTQTFTDFELIIIDDGGQDRSLEICRGFKDPRVRIFSQPNRGLAGARNAGIAAARGRYVALLDADDLWRPTKLMLHFIHLEAEPRVDVSYSGSRFIDDEGNVLKLAMRPRLTAITPGYILQRNPVGNGSAAVIRRTILDRAKFNHPDHPRRACWFDESFRQSEDIEFWVRLAAGHHGQFEGISGLLTDYRLNAEGLSANIARQFESWERMIDKSRSYAPNLVRKHGQAARAYQLRYLARRAIQQGDGPFATSLMVEALRAYPAMIAREPAKTLITLAAAMAARWLPRRHFRALMSRRLGTAPV